MTGLLLPEDRAELRDLLRDAGKSLVPCGNRTRWQRHNKKGSALPTLSLAKFNSIHDYRPADQVVEVGAGLSASSLADRTGTDHLGLAALAPSTAEGTLGGLFLAPDLSLLHGSCGPPRDQVLGGTWMLSDGTVVETGARVVKSVAGYDLTRLLLGSRGELAICLRLVLRLRPLPRQPRWLYLPPAAPLAELPAALDRLERRGRPARLAFTLGSGDSAGAWLQFDGPRSETEPTALFDAEEATLEQGRAAVAAALAGFAETAGRAAIHRSAATILLRAEQPPAVLDLLGGQLPCEPSLPLGVPHRRLPHRADSARLPQLRALMGSHNPGGPG